MNLQREIVGGEYLRVQFIYLMSSPLVLFRFLFQDERLMALGKLYQIPGSPFAIFSTSRGPYVSSSVMDIKGESSRFDFCEPHFINIAERDIAIRNYRYLINKVNEIAATSLRSIEIGNNFCKVRLSYLEGCPSLALKVLHTHPSLVGKSLVICAHNGVEIGFDRFPFYDTSSNRLFLWCGNYRDSMSVSIIFSNLVERHRTIDKIADAILTTTFDSKQVRIKVKEDYSWDNSYYYDYKLL